MRWKRWHAKRWTLAARQHLHAAWDKQVSRPTGAPKAARWTMIYQHYSSLLPMELYGLSLPATPATARHLAVSSIKSAVIGLVMPRRRSSARILAPPP